MNDKWIQFCVLASAGRWTEADEVLASILDGIEAGYAKPDAWPIGKERQIIGRMFRRLAEEVTT